ncbi:HD domain-containing protein [Microbacterium sp. JZ37]|nr:HD domain-containing protein [Microbacterium sp. JZ37]
MEDGRVSGWIARRAERFARAAHADQVDLLGNPYVDHPARVAARAEGDHVLAAIGWLHDVLEKTDTSIEDLRAEFPAHVVEAVDALSIRDDEPVEAYYGRVRANPLARAVKEHDLADNMRPERLAALDAATREVLFAKYERGQALLGLGAPAREEQPSTPLAS